jgi:hypothetical protein
MSSSPGWALDYVPPPAEWNNLWASKADASNIPVTGTTAARPAGAPLGWSYFDTTLGVPVWWNGTGWVNSTGGAV